MGVPCLHYDFKYGPEVTPLVLKYNHDQLDATLNSVHPELSRMGVDYIMAVSNSSR